MKNKTLVENKIKEIIPEIMELKFGCEVKVLFDDSDFYGKVEPYRSWFRTM